MSKKFRTQDYFRYKRMGKRWRRPKGLQSKLRIKKGGSGRKVSIGFGTAAVLKNRIQGAEFTLVHSAAEITGEGVIIIASGVGARKTAEIAAKAKEMNVRVLNMKKIRRAKKISDMIKAKKEASKKKEKEVQEAKEKAKEKEKDKPATAEPKKSAEKPKHEESADTKKE